MRPETIKSIYFLDEGLGSVLCVQPDGKSVEVGLIGKEGFVGTPTIFGLQSSALRVFVQTDGTAHRLDVGALLKILPQCPELTRRLRLFSVILAMQSTQIAACNRLHEVEERLAIWLLMSHDRVGANTMPLTQEFLGQMLGHEAFQRQHSGKRATKSRHDHLHPWAGHDCESQAAVGGSLRLLSHHSEPGANLESGIEFVHLTDDRDMSGIKQCEKCGGELTSQGTIL